jgi:hypothetical protein
MPGSTDTASGLHKIAIEGVTTSLAILEQGTKGDLSATLNISNMPYLHDKQPHFLLHML